MDFEGRNLLVRYPEISIMSMYLPSGTNQDRLDFKFNYMDDFLDYTKSLKETDPNLVICGDYNICHQAIDIHDPVRNKNISGFLPEERAWLSALLESGFTDSFRQISTAPDQYSWWSYRANSRANNKGWRLDYALVSSPLAAQISNAQILSAAVHSDHCPVTVEISL
jgi:exodeoxyribonuclease-3